MEEKSRLEIVRAGGQSRIAFTPDLAAMRNGFPFFLFEASLEVKMEGGLSMCCVLL